MLTPVAPGTAPHNGFVGAQPAVVHFNYSHDGILRSVKESLTRRGLTHINLLRVHDVGIFTHGAEAPRHMADFMDSGIVALNQLKQQGVIGAWGIGVNEVAVSLKVIERTLPDVILMAGRYSLLDRTAEADLLPVCRAKGVPLVLGGVVNTGILATGAVPDAKFNYETASPDILARVAAMGGHCMDHGTSHLTAALTFPQG